MTRSMNFLCRQQRDIADTQVWACYGHTCNLENCAGFPESRGPVKGPFFFFFF